MAEKKMNLHLFEGGAGAGAAPAAGEEGGGEAAVVTPGTLEDGTEVDARLAARMEAQAQRRRARGQEPMPARRQAGPAAGDAAQQNPAEGQNQPQEKSLDDEWEELRKGKFRELYARDVQGAIQDRFKNQQAQTETLAKLQPMLSALAKQKGVAEGDLDGLSKAILDDDSLYEEEADAAGMTVERYKLMKQLENENARLREREQQDRENALLRQHFQNLTQQAEELKKTFPDFDLMRELQDPKFRRLTDRNSGLTLADAYYAVHHAELEPQAMAYGIQRAQQQISRTLQANAQRPTEGASQGRAPANISVSPRQMTRAQRQALRERAARGEEIVF
jgi:hypothetical protein